MSRFVVPLLPFLLTGCFVIDAIRGRVVEEVVEGPDGPSGVMMTTDDDEMTTMMDGPSGPSATTNPPVDPPVEVPEAWGLFGTSGHTGAFTSLELLAGAIGGAGHANDSGELARFDTPRALAVDAAGNVYLGESTGCVIRKITPTGDVTTIAGRYAFCSSSDNTTGLNASFSNLRDMVYDPAADALYVISGNRIRKIVLSGNIAVSTLAGADSAGLVDDTLGSASRFSSPQGLALGPAGFIFVADTGNRVIRRVDTTTGATTRITTSPGTTDSDLSSAVACGSLTITSLEDVVYAGTATDYHLYVIADFPGRVIDIDYRDSGATCQASLLTDVLGGSGVLELAGLDFLDASHLLVAEWNWGSVFSVDVSTGASERWAGEVYGPGSIEGPRLQASYIYLNDIVRHGTRVYVCEYIGRVSYVDTTTDVSVHLAGLVYNGDRNVIWRDSSDGNLVRMHDPNDLVLHSDGSFYVSEATPSAHDHLHVRKVDPSTGASATIDLEEDVLAHPTDPMRAPRGLAFDPSGRLWISNGYTYEDENHVLAAYDLAQVGAEGAARLVFVGADRAPLADGDAATARFDEPSDISFAEDGTGYVVDEGHGKVRILTFPGGAPSVSTLAGSYDLPHALHVVGTNLFVAADTAVWRFDLTQSPPTGLLLAGQTNDADYVDGSGTFARFRSVSGIVVDKDGNLYVSEYGNFRVRHLAGATIALSSAEVTVSTVAGDGVRGVKLGPLPTRLNNATSLAMFGGLPHFISETSILRLR